VKGAFVLSEEVKARRLNINGDAAIVGIWNETASAASRDAGTLFNALLQENSIIHYVLGLQDFDLSGLNLESDPHQVTDTILADAVFKVAERYAHTAVNEVHLLLALLELCPDKFERQFASLQIQYRRKFPLGTPRQQNLLRIAKESGTEWRVQRAMQMIEDTPFTQSKVAKSLGGYLSAMYYPFGLDEWQKYCHDRPAHDDRQLRQDVHDHSLHGFSAHRLRDERKK
jgi:hypothetical protein